MSGLRNITPGETVASEKTIYFSEFTADGALADGGTDAPDYEGSTLGTPELIEYEHNRDGWVAATGTFGVTGFGEWYYIFADAEVAIGLSRGTVAVRVTKAGFRRQTERVQFGSGIQPGDTGDQARIYTKIFTGPGLLANGGSSAYEDAAIGTPDHVEWDHNLGGFNPAIGTYAQHDDEWCYDPDPTEVGALLARGTVAVRVRKAGYRPQVARRGFGDTAGAVGATPIITGVSPTPNTAIGAPGAFITTLDPVVITIEDVGTLGLRYLSVTVRLANSGSSAEEVALRDGAFVGRYSASTSAVVGTLTTLTLRRTGGWTGSMLLLSVVAIDDAGNLAAATLPYPLPTVSVVVQATSDHAAAAIARLCEVFKEASPV